jgi:hypothetical protein
MCEYQYVLQRAMSTTDALVHALEHAVPLEREEIEADGTSVTASEQLCIACLAATSILPFAKPVESNHR